MMPPRATATVALLWIAAACSPDAPTPSLERGAGAETAKTLGLAYLEEDRNREAAAEFATLSLLAPEDPAGPANRAVAQLRGGELEAARQTAGDAVERAPDRADVRVIAAAIAAENGDEEARRRHLAAALRADSIHVPALWGWYEATGDLDALERLLRRVPGNLPARLTAAEAYAAGGNLDEATRQLERTEELLAPGDTEPRDALRAALDSLAVDSDDAGDAPDAADAADPGGLAGPERAVRVLHNLLRVDPAYRRGLVELTGSVDARVAPIRRLAVEARPAAAPGGPMDIAFTREETATGAWAYGVPLDVNADGRLDLLVATADGARCLTVPIDDASSIACDVGGPFDGPLLAADFDGDARADLLLGGSGGVRVLRAADGGFEPYGEFPDDGPADVVLAADLDHDGDLDVLAGGPGPTRLYRQAEPGRFAEVGRDAGVAGTMGLRGASFGDVDLDGDLDLLLTDERGLAILRNARQGIFESETVTRGRDGTPILADLDNDGWLDAVVADEGGIWWGAGGPDGFAPLRLSAQFPDAPGAVVPLTFVEDLDLDGRLDVVVAGPDAPVRIFRGLGTGALVPSDTVFVSGEVPAGPATLLDADGDQDLDLVVGGAGGGLFVNRGGERNGALEISLLALASGNGKVNRFGIGSRLDVWAGELRQTRVVRSELELVGLGERTEADVVRVEWTNGVPQNVFRPGTGERLVETQVLKGSCAFLYAWDGTAVRLVTDFMWKSALGMPLGIMAGDLAYAPPDPSLEYVRIAPDLLASREGSYELRITEELWEVAYLDELELVVVDHPEALEVYVNEAFGPPTRPNATLHVVDAPRAAEGAEDHRGRDVADLLAERDFAFVGGFDRSDVQGIATAHDLTLRLEGAAGRPATLYLAGWVFPTDASINVRLAQAGASGVQRPALSVPDGDGWRTIAADIDFPSGKNKTVVVRLPDGLPSDDPRVRLSTNMEIYWDQAFYTIETSDFSPRPVRLRPSSARLSERGFSAPFRRGGRYGPHWFDYDTVESSSPWRPLPGAYTRTGDVTPLLAAADDRYVVFGPGDEIAVRFDALEPPPPGMKRTFFVYSDGFLKDADLNTLGGDRTGPFPRHGQAAYPPGASGGADSAFVENWLTRARAPAGPPARPASDGGARYSR